MKDEKDYLRKMLVLQNVLNFNFCAVMEYSLTLCPRSSYPFYIVSYCIKWVTASWTHSSIVYGECLEKDDTRVNSAATGPNSSRNRLLGQEIFSLGGTNLDLEAWALPREAPRL